MTRPADSAVHWRERGSGPPLVLINGWGASGLVWPRSWLDDLAHRYRVIRPDNRGTGWSRFAETPFTMADLAADVRAILDAADVDTAVIAGISMGGMIAQELTLRSPDRVSGLVLVATAPPLPAFRPTVRSPLLLHLLRPPGRGPAFEAYLHRLWADAAAPGFDERHPEVIDELVSQSLARRTPRSLALAQARAIMGWGHAERLRRIRVPTVIVHGACDPLINPTNGREIACRITGSEYIELPGVGHLIPHEAPRPLLEIVAEMAGMTERSAGVPLAEAG